MKVIGNKLNVALKPTDTIDPISSKAKDAVQTPTILHRLGCGVSFFIRIKSVFVSIWSQMVRQVLQNIQLNSVNVVK